jgi:hypothetical protein
MQGDRRDWRWREKHGGKNMAGKHAADEDYIAIIIDDYVFGLDVPGGGVTPQRRGTTQQGQKQYDTCE